MKIENTGIKQNKRRHRAILWARDNKVYSFRDKDLWTCKLELTDEGFRVKEPPKLKSHPKAIRKPCLECGKMNHRIKNEYFATWGTCDVQCYADMVGVNLYGM